MNVQNNISSYSIDVPQYNEPLLKVSQAPQFQVSAPVPLPQVVVSAPTPQPVYQMSAPVQHVVAQAPTPAPAPAPAASALNSLSKADLIKLLLVQLAKESDIEAQK